MLFIGLLLISSISRADDLDRHFKDQYVNKGFLLRNFYAGSHLTYDSSGILAEPARTGDWTADGIVEVNRIRVARSQLQIEATRMFAVADSKNGFSLVRSSKKVHIEISLQAGPVTAAQIDAVLLQVFLTRQERLSDLVPDYWKPCIKVALTADSNETYRGCRFSGDLGAFLNAGAYSKIDPAMSIPPLKVDIQLAARGPDHEFHRIENGVTPPKPVSSREPDFTDASHVAHVHGVVTLSLVVDKTGVPNDIRIVGPLGCGLDANAVHAVETWRFKPAEKDGQPVRVEIAVEVDFHVY